MSLLTNAEKIMALRKERQNALSSLFSDNQDRRPYHLILFHHQISIWHYIEKHRIPHKA